MSYCELHIFFMKNVHFFLKYYSSKVILDKNINSVVSANSLFINIMHFYIYNRIFITYFMVVLNNVGEDIGAYVYIKIF